MPILRLIRSGAPALALLVAGLAAGLVSGCGGSAPSPAETATAPQASTSTPASAPAVPPGQIPSSDPSSAPDLSSSADTVPLSCSAQIGEAAARRLAARCVAVSPATRPPCNAANSCAMIRNEVARGCAMLGEDAARTPQCGGIDPVGKLAAADMVERYYDAINARDYASAWTLWGPNAEAGGKTLTGFAQGFAHTRRVHVDIGAVSDVEGGAGSLYVTVPVTLDAELGDGRRQRFTGSYDLRQINRGMGVSQGWHIMTAKLRPS